MTFALSSGLTWITPTKGRVDQSNFDDFPLVRMHDAPDVDVHLVDTGGEMGGIEEVGVPGVLPGPCAAIYQASRVRMRKMPGDLRG